MKSHFTTITLLMYSLFQLIFTSLITFYAISTNCVWATDSTAHIHPEIKPKDPADMLTIYQYNSELTNPEGYILDIQSLLEQNGVHVLSINTGYDGLVYPFKNDSKPADPKPENQKIQQAFSKKPYFHQGHIVIITVLKADWNQDKINKKDFHLCSELEDRGGHCYIGSYADLFPKTRDKYYVSVYKSADNKQCASETEEHLNEMEKELIENKIFVYKKYKGTSGELYTLQCGYNTNTINIYVIESYKLGAALSLGFRECAYLKTKGQDCYPL